MADKKNQVTLTFAGDTKSLERAAARVAATNKKLETSFGRLHDKLTRAFPAAVFSKLGVVGETVLKALPQQLHAPALLAGAGIGALMASAIGAAVTAAVLLAVGGGVLAAGIKAAAKDPKVQAAWKEFGDRANKAFANFGGPFKGPTIRAADTFADALERMAPTLNRMGATLAPVVDKLAPALAMMAESALPGIEKAAVASVPLFEKLAEFMPKIGLAIDSFFTSIAEGGPGALTFFDHALTAIAMTIIATGKVFSFLASSYQDMIEKGRAVRDYFRDTASAIGLAFRSMGDGIRNAWNNTVGRINFRVPDWVPGLGGKSFAMPKFHQGGIVSGAMGAETLAVLQAGERVTPAGGGGGQVVTLRVVGNDRAIVELIKRLVKLEGGGDVQAAFGR